MEDTVEILNVMPKGHLVDVWEQYYTYKYNG